MKGTLSLSSPELSFLQYRLENFLLKLPENRFSADKLHFQKLTAENLSGDFNEELNGTVKFTLYGGKGIFTCDVEDEAEQFAAAFGFNVRGLALSEFVRALSNEVCISGILDIDGKGKLAGGGSEVAASFRSRPVRGVKQVMNFSAIRVLASMGGGNPIRVFGSSDFGYSLIAGRLTVKDNHLTIEGLAGEKGKQNLLIKGGVFGGVNLSVDRTSNTIRIEEVKRRVEAATKSIKR